MKLEILKETFAVCQIPSGQLVPDWATKGAFFSITQTQHEVSIVCEQAVVPLETKAEREWRAFKVAGTLDFNLCGILASIANPLAQANISIFAVSTFDTDYVLVQSKNLEATINALTRAGFEINKI